MPRDCAVNCDHLQTLSTNKVGSIITTLNSKKMHQEEKAGWSKQQFKAAGRKR